jgi:hypothetical protein
MGIEVDLIPCKSNSSQIHSNPSRKGINRTRPGWDLGSGVGLLKIHRSWDRSVLPFRGGI